MASDTQLERELKKLIAAEIARLTDIVVTGVAIKDYADYKHHVGQIKSLKRVDENYIDEALTNANK